MSPILHDLTKHPVPDDFTPELISSVTVPTLNKWISAKGITVEAALLHSIAAETEPCAADAKLSPAAEEQDDVTIVDVEHDVIASAINHIRKKMKTEQYDKAVIETVTYLFKEQHLHEQDVQTITVMAVKLAFLLKR